MVTFIIVDSRGSATEEFGVAVVSSEEFVLEVFLVDFIMRKPEGGGGIFVGSVKVRRGEEGGEGESFLSFLDLALR